MGDFSRDPQTVLQDALNKGYSRVRFQQGKPVLDRELNLLGDLASPQRLAEHHLGNGVPAGSNGFRISGLDVAAGDFTIEAGRCLLAGQEVLLTANTTYKTQPNDEHVAPFPSGTSNVYLHVFPNEVDGTEDGGLNNPGDVGLGLTTVREKVEWEVLVTPTVITASDHFLLAEIDRAAGTATDRRRIGLTMATMLGRIDTSLAADGALRDNVVSNAQIVDNAVTAAKLQSHSSDNTQRAVGKTHIQNGAVSIAQLSATRVFDGLVSVPAAPAAGQVGQQTITLETSGGHVFYFISVRYVSPTPTVVLLPRSLMWQHKSTMALRTLGIVTHRHELVIQNPNLIGITASYKVYRLAET